jgi:hypothetical protein
MRKLILVMLAATCLDTQAQGSPPPVVEPGSPQASSTISYKTVAAALADLRKRQDVTFEEQKSGWIIALEPGGVTSWSFVPRNHLAYPAVVKRTLVDFGGGDYNVLMSVLCEGRSKACEELTAEFNARNAKLREDIARERDQRK